MLVLGVSDLKHDTAAALLDREGPVAALEEEKLTRSSTSSGIPTAAIDRCLHDAGAELSDVCVAAIASRRILYEAPRHRNTTSGSAIPYTRPHADGPLKQLSDQLLRQSSNRRARLVRFDHHLCHAASAFYPSDFDRALIVTLDEAGDRCSGMIALGEGGELRVLNRIRFPHSLGWFYTQVTGLLGFRPHRDEHKVQWLSKQGAPDFIQVFRKLFSKDSEGLPIVNSHCLANLRGDGPGFSAEIGRDLHVAACSSPRDSALGASIARSAQDFLEETVVELIETYRRKTRSRHLCLAGGVFLNVLLVRALEKHAGFQKVLSSPSRATRVRPWAQRTWLASA